MDRKAIIGFILLMLILLLWPYWNRLFYPPPQSLPERTTETISAEREAPAPTSAEVIRASQAAADSQLPPEQLIRVENEDMVAIFTSRGGLLKSLALKGYSTENNGLGKNNVFLVDSLLRSPWPVAGVLTLGRDDSLHPLNHLPFEVDGRDLTLRRGDPPQTLTFTYRQADGALVQRQYTFSGEGFDFGFKLRIVGASRLGFGDKVTTGWLAPVSPTEKDYREDLGKFSAFYHMGGEVVEHKKVDKSAKLQVLTGKSKWVAVRTKYFANVLLVESGDADEVVVGGQEDVVVDFAGKSHQWKKFGVGLTAATTGDSLATSFVVYTGPLDYYRLEWIGFGLSKLIDLGWTPFRPFAIAILWVFLQLHRVFNNYGLVIIVFSVLMKVIFWPLTRKSSAAMYKMKELAPKLQEIKTRYKDDPQKLNAETIKLYREYGVNPFGSCLPLLIQLPIFWAMFSVLKNSIELRAAEFVFWIKDLSQKDQYYVLPIVMGISMFIQQKLTITDPKQKALVYMMPALFTILFAQWPSGLVLYWTIFNVVGIFEQVSIKRRLERQKEAAS